MNKEQKEHYLKGGRFKAIYNPKSLDISNESKQYIGKSVIIEQNIIITPLITPEKFAGQHAFNCSDIYGWSPEEDFDNIEIIDDYKDNIESLPQYMYKLHYLKQEKLEPNFGKGNWKIPMIVGREYGHNADNYIMSLSKPQACKIEKAVWNGEDYKDIKWKTLYEEK